MRCTVLIILSIVPAVFGINICSTREITSSSGEITSPNYPNNYSANTDCTLTIKQPLDTKFIFNFTYIDLGGNGYSYSCSDDFITISGRTSRQFCGAEINHPYEFNLNVVTLQFKSNNNTELTGFKLVFTSVINKTPRGRQLPGPISVCPSRTIEPDEVGRIMSPGYPTGNYGKKVNCRLTLNVPFQKKLQIVNEHMGIACDKERLMFQESGYFGSKCGKSWKPELVQRGDFKEGDVGITYRSDGNTHNKGFMLSYRLLDKYRLDCLRANGRQYLKKAINMADFLKSPNGDISLIFRTRRSSGLLLYIKGAPNMYLLLKLHRRRIVFEIKHGSGKITLTSQLRKLHKNRWYKVVVERREKNVSLAVNPYPPKHDAKICRDIPLCIKYPDYRCYDEGSDFSEVCGMKCGRCSVPYRPPNTVSTQIPFNITQLPNNLQNGGKSAMYVLGGPSDSPFPRKFKGWVQHFVINDLQPIASYKAKDTTFTLHGSKRLKAYECYTD